MSTLLLGRWDWAGNLVITESHQVPDDDQDDIDRLLNEQNAPNTWAASFDVDSHKDAIQRAYDEYVADDGDQLIDKVHGFQPSTA